MTFGNLAKERVDHQKKERVDQTMSRAIEEVSDYKQQAVAEEADAGGGEDDEKKPLTAATEEAVEEAVEEAADDSDDDDDVLGGDEPAAGGVLAVAAPAPVGRLAVVPANDEEFSEEALLFNEDPEVAVVGAFGQLPFAIEYEEEEESSDGDYVVEAPSSWGDCRSIAEYEAFIDNRTKTQTDAHIGDLLTETIVLSKDENPKDLLLLNLRKALNRSNDDSCEIKEELKLLLRCIARLTSKNAEELTVVSFFF
jgi:hypothetical protein